MLLTCAAVTLMLADASSAKVGYEQLVEGSTAAAVEELQSNTGLDAEDPARLINLGIAYARQGRTEDARVLFEAAMRSSDRAVLETASGEWKDSRHLARLAIKMLESGEFRSGQMAAR